MIDSLYISDGDNLLELDLATAGNLMSGNIIKGAHNDKQSARTIKQELKEICALTMSGVKPVLRTCLVAGCVDLVFSPRK